MNIMTVHKEEKVSSHNVPKKKGSSHNAPNKGKDGRKGKKVK